MKRYTAYETMTDPEDWEETDEILHLDAPLGSHEMKRRLARTPWLQAVIAQDWPGATDSPYIDAWAAAARTILVSKVVRSRNPVDLSPILGLHSSFILVVLVICETLESAGALSGLDRALRAPIVNSDRVSGELRIIMSEKFGTTIHVIDLMKGLGLDL